MSLRDGVRRLLAEIEVSAQRSTEREAAGFIVVVVDTDTKADWQESVTSAYGPCPSPEQALALAGVMDADPLTGVNPSDGSPGWRHIVVPIFDPEDR